MKELHPFVPLERVEMGDDVVIVIVIVIVGRTDDAITMLCCLQLLFMSVSLGN